MRTNAKEIPKQFAATLAGLFLDRVTRGLHNSSQNKIPASPGRGNSLKKHFSPVTGYTKEVVKSPKDKKNGKKKKVENQVRSFEASSLLVPPFYLCHRYIVVSIVAAFPFVPRRFSTGCEAEESSSGGSKQGLEEGGRPVIH